MGIRFKNLRTPDETFTAPLLDVAVVQLGDWTVELEIDEPGWRWSKDMKPLVGTEWCEGDRHLFDYDALPAATEG